MLRKTTAVALLTLTGAALLPAASASALASVKTVTIHVVGIDRTGAQVGVASEVTAVHGNSQPGIGPALRQGSRGAARRRGLRGRRPWLRDERHAGVGRGAVQHHGVSQPGRLVDHRLPEPT
jgi:hypothetical protein